MKIYHPELYGKQVYPNYRIDKNISWYNINNFISGLIFSFLTFEFIRDYKVFFKRFSIGKIWLPMVYADGFYTEDLTNED